MGEQNKERTVEEEHVCNCTNNTAEQLEQIKKQNKLLTHSNALILSNLMIYNNIISKVSETLKGSKFVDENNLKPEVDILKETTVAEKYVFEDLTDSLIDFRKVKIEAMEEAEEVLDMIFKALGWE